MFYLTWNSDSELTFFTTGNSDSPWHIIHFCSVLKLRGAYSAHLLLTEVEILRRSSFDKGKKDAIVNPNLYGIIQTDCLILAQIAFHAFSECQRFEFQKYKMQYLRIAEKWASIFLISMDLDGRCFHSLISI